MTGHTYTVKMLRCSINLLKTKENKVSVSLAYDYTCRFCFAVSSVFVSLDVAFRANRAASHGNYEEAKKIVLEQ